MSFKARKTAGAKSEPVKPLPGARRSQPADTANYLVLLKESDEDEDASRGRREFYEAGLARSARFWKKLKSWLEEQGIDEGQCTVGEPTVFPMLAITCTPDLVARLQSLPEVDDVVRDGGDLTITR